MKSGVGQHYLERGRKEDGGQDRKFMHSESVASNCCPGCCWLCSASGRAETASRADLKENWLLQSSCKVSEPGEVLSTPQFAPVHWYKATVPSTVLAAQVADGEFHDIYMPTTCASCLAWRQVSRSGNPYACSWWYRTEFQLPQNLKGRQVWLHFDGINTRANVWLNGKKLADAKEMAGAYRLFELDATASH
jgi:exo-1,4-beta-D-glucosaminidase